MRMLKFFRTALLYWDNKEYRESWNPASVRLPAKRRDRLRRVPRASTESNLHNVTHAKTPRRKDFIWFPAFLASPQGLAVKINEPT